MVKERKRKCIYYNGKNSLFIFVPIFWYINTSFIT